MFTKLEINRFRSFELFSMDNIAPITLIGGRNNSGKSAILEAIFLLFGFRNPDIYYALAFGRNGNGQLKISPQKIWDPLFYNFDQTQSFQIKMYRANDVVSDLKMEKVPDDKIGFDNKGKPLDGTLEDLCWKIVKKSDQEVDSMVLKNLAGKYLDETQAMKESGFKTIHKNKLHTYFSGTDKFVGMKIGEAAKAECFDFARPELDFLKQAVLDIVV